jgi:glutamate synthase (NADPH/NADH) small chain
VGSTQWRDLSIKGRELKGIYQAMEFLPWGNKQALGEIEVSPINVAGKHVVILGGGDTGADCLGHKKSELRFAFFMSCFF